MADSGERFVYVNGAAYVDADRFEEVKAERDALAKALAEMPMPSYGPGTAWPTEECPFCSWVGQPDRGVRPEKQEHGADCPVRLARELLSRAEREPE